MDETATIDNGNDNGTDNDNTSVSRRSMLRTAGAGAALIAGLGVSSNPAAARVSDPMVQIRASNLAMTSQQSTRFGRTYVYVVRVKNTSKRRRRIKGYGKGPRNAYTPVTISGRSTGKFVFKTSKPLNRIVFTS